MNYFSEFFSKLLSWEDEVLKLELAYGHRALYNRSVQTAGIRNNVIKKEEISRSIPGRKSGHRGLNQRISFRIFPKEILL